MKIKNAFVKLNDCFTFILSLFEFKLLFIDRTSFGSGTDLEFFFFLKRKGRKINMIFKIFLYNLTYVHTFIKL